MPAATAQPTTAQPGPKRTEAPEEPSTLDARLRDATLHWPDSVANPRRIRVR